jgi:hypothetical protein
MTPVKRSPSPIKREVANKFLKVMETIGNYEFTPEDITTQEEMIEKLNYVEKNIKRIKNSTRGYN